MSIIHNVGLEWDACAYATFFSRSKQGHFLQRLASDFLYFLQHLDLHLPVTEQPLALSLWMRSFLSFLSFFFPKSLSEKNGPKIIILNQSK